MQLTITFVTLVGAVIALGCEWLAIRSLHDLKKVLTFSTLAQLGYVLIGVNSATADGFAGAGLHLFFQASARLLWYISLRSLAGPRKDFTFKAICTAGARLPRTAMLMGFAMFTAIGLTPFTAPPGKAMLLLAAMEGGHLLAGLLLAAAGTIAVVYTVRIIHGACQPHTRNAEEEGATESGPTSGIVLAGALALACLLAGPLFNLTGSLLPSMSSGTAAQHGWSYSAMLPYLGAFAMVAVVRLLPALTGPSAMVLAAVTVAFAIAEPAADPVLRLFVLLFALGGGVIVVYSTGYIGTEKGADKYYFFLFIMLASLIGLARAENSEVFHGCFELMTFSSYMLVIHKRTRESLAAGAKYLIMCVGGANFMQIGLLALDSTGMHGGLNQMAGALAVYSPLAAACVTFALLAGFAVKAGFFPAHSWLPAAHPVAPSSISAPLSGLLTKVGIMGVVFVVAAVAASPAGNGHWILGLLTIMSVITFLLGELMALVQKDIKRMLAYSTLAQIGEIGLILSLGTYAATTGALAHVVNHAIMKDLLFLAAGGFIMHAGSQRLEDLAGLGKAMPFAGACMAVGLVSIMGLPPMGGFFSKFLMLKAAMDAGQVWMAVLIFTGSVVGCVYYGRIIKTLFFSGYEGKPVEELPLGMNLGIGVLAALTLASGLFPTQWVSLVVPAATALFPAGGTLPDVAIGWSPAAILPLLGAVCVLALRGHLKKSAMVATGSVLLALVAVLLPGGFETSLQRYFAVLVLALGALNLFYSAGYMSHSRTTWRFLAVFLVMLSGLVGMTTAASLLTFFFFWELMSSWPLFFVIIHEETPAALAEGTKYFLFNIIGASVLFLGMLHLGHASGGFGFGDVIATVSASPAGVWLPGMVLMAVGMFMKAAMLPVRIDWQMHPPSAPTPVSGYISAMLLKSGPFGILLLRFVFAQHVSADAAPALDAVMYIGAWIGGITILYAAVQALLQTGIKEMLIYSTVSQLGYIVLGICLGTTLGVSGGLLHLFNHMLFKDLAFLCAGALMYASHVHNLEELGGMGRRMPVTFLCFSVALFSAAGMPPFNGFSSKLILYYALIERGEILLAIISILASVITLAYFLKFMHGAFFGQLSPAAAHAEEVGPAMRIPLVILAGLCLLTGIFPGIALMPIAALEQTMGLTPPPVTLAGIASGPGSCDMTLLSFMFFLAGFGIWSAVSRLVAGRVRRTPIHTCGETSVNQTFTNVGAGNLYAAPLQLLTSVSKGYLTLKRFGGQHD
jgi:formate hydrogenlyase subunit 3/multisubunit Na+/H+ antiporter MnhD subunit